MTQARRWPIVAAFAFIAIAVLAVRPAPTPGPLLRDFEAYWSAGGARNAGESPYGRAIWNAERTVPGVDPTRDELLPFVGPPVGLVLWSAFARLPYDAAVRLWYGLLAAAALALAVVALRGSGARATAPAVLAAAAAAAAFGPLTSDLALGQIALIAFLGATVVALPAARAARTLLPMIAGTFVALLQPNVAVGLISQFDRARTALAIALGAVASYLVGAALAGWDWPLRYARQLLAHENGERFSAIQFTPVAIAHGAGGSATTVALAGIVAAAVAATAAVAIWRRVAEPFARFAGFSALLPFAAGFFHEHDFVVAYAAVIWCAVRTQGAARALALAGTLLTAIDWLGLAQRPTGVAQSALLALAAACAFAALTQTGATEPPNAALTTPAPSTIARRTSVWPMVSAIGSITAIFIVAAWLAHGHPSPVWPDTLGNFHVSASASAAQVWFAEQQRSGLLAVSPVWAALRALSLLGCALLACAIYISHPIVSDAARP